MDAGVVFAVIAVVVVLAAVGAFWLHLRGRVHPEDTAGHDTRYTPDRLQDERMVAYPGTDRPAGPGAEGMAPGAPGDVIAGPEPHNDRSGWAGDADATRRRR